MDIGTYLEDQLKVRRNLVPIKEHDGKWYWGEQGPFSTKEQAHEVAQAAYSSGYQGSFKKFLAFQKGKYTQEEVQYDVASPEQLELGQKCGSCSYFQLEEGKCLIVEGNIHDDMWCDKWEEADHISLKSVANITKAQTQALHSAGIHSLKALANSEYMDIITLSKEAFIQLQSQARLQETRIEAHQHAFELLPLEKGRGVDRLPVPDAEDICFDMESDSHHTGIEYLFGFQKSDGSYNNFWAHSEVDEQIAFTEVLNYLSKHLEENPNAYIYHYNHYEPTALRKLCVKHEISLSVLEPILLKFIDLYPIAKESVRVSQPRFRLKDLEVYYMNKREQEIVSAIGSIDTYQIWKESRDESLLEKIEQYNQSDCMSTGLLRNWLLDIQKLEGSVFTSDMPGVYTPTYGKFSNRKKQSTTEHFKEFAQNVLGLTVGNE